MGDCSLLKKEILLGGLGCSHCAKAISKTVSNLEEVEGCNLDFEAQKLTIDILDIYNGDEVVSKVVDIINSIEPDLDIDVTINSVNSRKGQKGRGKNMKSLSRTEVNDNVNPIKVEFILNGLNCAHCADVINEKVGKLEGVKSSNLNFVNKKLTLNLTDGKDESEIIRKTIDIINNTEPGLDIVVNNKSKSGIKKEIILGGLNCAHCAEVIGQKVSNLTEIESSDLNFINKKLTVIIKQDENSKQVIEKIIDIINNTEPGLDINIVENSKQANVSVEEKEKDSSKKDLLKLIVGFGMYAVDIYQSTI